MCCLFLRQSAAIYMKQPHKIINIAYLDTNNILMNIYQKMNIFNFNENRNKLN